MLDKIFSGRHTEKNRFYFYQKIGLDSFGDNVHEMSNLFFWGKWKNVTSLSSVEIAQIVVKVKGGTEYFEKFENSELDIQDYSIFQKPYK